MASNARGSGQGGESYSSAAGAEGEKSRFGFRKFLKETFTKEGRQSKRLSCDKSWGDDPWQPTKTGGKALAKPILIASSTTGSRSETRSSSIAGEAAGGEAAKARTSKTKLVVKNTFLEVEPVPEDDEESMMGGGDMSPGRRARSMTDTHVDYCSGGSDYDLASEARSRVGSDDVSEIGWTEDTAPGPEEVSLADSTANGAGGYPDTFQEDTYGRSDDSDEIGMKPLPPGARWYEFGMVELDNSPRSSVGAPSTASTSTTIGPPPGALGLPQSDAVRGGSHGSNPSHGSTAEFSPRSRGRQPNEAPGQSRRSRRSQPLQQVTGSLQQKQQPTVPPGQQAQQVVPMPSYTREGVPIVWVPVPANALPSMYASQHTAQPGAVMPGIALPPGAASPCLPPGANALPLGAPGTASVPRQQNPNQAAADRMTAVNMAMRQVAKDQKKAEDKARGIERKPKDKKKAEEPARGAKDGKEPKKRGQRGGKRDKSPDSQDGSANDSPAHSPASRGSSVWGTPPGSPMTRGREGKPPPPKIKPEERTTLMMRNLPQNYTRDMLLEDMDSEGFAGQYDFVYLPTDFRSWTGFGYAFVNMVSHEPALRMLRVFPGYDKWQLPSDKLCEVDWSDPHQGLSIHIDRYRNSPVMHEDVPDIYKPVIFSEGVRAAFPEATKRIRLPRLRRSMAPGALADGEVGEEELDNDGAA